MSRCEAMRLLIVLGLYLHQCASSVIKQDVEAKQLELMDKLFKLREHNATFAEGFDKAFAVPMITKNTFSCPKLPPSSRVPTSVHSLRPGDIKVVAAIGDSLTAGRGADGGVIGLLIDYRGLSWSAGGSGDYGDHVTLPNILRQYNSDIYGYSEGIGSLFTRLNVAKSGAKSDEGLQQAKDLVSKLQKDKHVNFANDWKLITIFLGANDLCDYCDDEALYSVAQYYSNLQKTLDYLLDSVPRAFVNLVEMLRVEMVRDLAKNQLCEIIHSTVCDCAANPANPQAEAKLTQLREGYQDAARQLVASGRYDVREDFTVVLQPFYRDTQVPIKSDGGKDLSYFASDCFHLSKKGQVAAAEAIWNNLVERVGSKRTAWSPGEPIECPSEASPYLFTARNSNSTSRP